jgi:hypothetical protein
MPGTVNYNPGEPVFDQATGEPYIDEFGMLVEVAPGLKVETTDGRTIDGDDVACAAYYRANKFLGETLRDASIGVPYLSEVLGQTNQQLAATVVVGEVRTRTPGVAGIIGVRVDGTDPITRVMQFSAVIIRKDGAEQGMSTVTGG